MTTSPDPYFLTPHGTVPDLDAETDNPTIGRINGFFLDEAFSVRSDGVFAADRDLAKRIDADVPGYRWWVLAQQRFLYDVIAFAAEERGISQFVVLRAPLPLGPEKKTPHTHAKAYLRAPSTVLMAREEMLFGHQHTALAMLEEERAAAVTAAVHEVHRPLHLLHERGGWSLDLTTPVGLTMVADPAHWPGDVTALIRAYHEELPPGSVIGVNTLGTAPPGSAATAALDDLARHLALTPEPQLTPRPQAEVESWFAGTGWTLEPPGVAPVSHWCGPQPADITGPELPAWGVIATRDAS
ncbi:SAM-dependent methyltransferase [Amycolatopsis sp. NPDC049868]|uniref:SAM-dependent methyltransferase n=1 Tax=Amycolatopsis sp. NPDC049868 TaxID=3363934 RepID=UPI0037B4422C